MPLAHLLVHLAVRAAWARSRPRQAPSSSGVSGSPSARRAAAVAAAGVCICLHRQLLSLLDHATTLPGGADDPPAGEDGRLGLDGIHHVTAITADAPGTLDFYVRRMGLRLVKKTVNFDAPDMYHLYLGDEIGSPGSILTFFEIPGIADGRPGPGMIHRVVWRVASPEALDFWAERLADAGRPVERAGARWSQLRPGGAGARAGRRRAGRRPRRGPRGHRTSRPSTP